MPSVREGLLCHRLLPEVVFTVGPHAHNLALWPKAADEIPILKMFNLIVYRSLLSAKPEKYLLLCVSL